MSPLSPDLVSRLPLVYMVDFYRETTLKGHAGIPGRKVAIVFF